ncbi:MAG: mobilization protein, partial [Bacteroidaceae bacterium]|nr:mobilization protein [Bacteroidaceae bacterium]
EEIDRLKRHISWQNQIISCLSYLLLRTNEIFRKAVNNIIHLAKDYWQQRFDVGQVAEVKNALNLFGDDKQSQQTAGDFLYFTAKQKGGFDCREQIKARREIDNVVNGHYDYTIKRGLSIKR